MTTTHWDPEQVLPMARVREHTRTDDVEVLSDTVLIEYRAAALDAATRYTGVELLSQNSTTDEFYWDDVFPRSSFGGMVPPNTVFTVKKAFTDKVAYVHGSAVMNGRAEVPVQPGSRTLRLAPNTCVYPLVVNGCGAPVMRVTYAYGATCPSQLPSAFITGCLKYIAHLIENPSDPSDPAVASGAIYEWNAVKVQLF